MIAKVCLLLSLVAAVFGGPSQPQYGYAPPPSHEEPAKYDFNYAVKDDYSGNDFGHQEARDGYDTQGSYYICLLLSLVAAVFGGPSQPQYGYAPPPSHEEPAKYDFNYAVKDDYSGNDFGHQEAPTEFLGRTHKYPESTMASMETFLTGVEWPPPATDSPVGTRGQCKPLHLQMVLE
ncbi:uncharacterized protein [Palaemon carinicauda]|uniref:uncharacterized protein n=1 Tax=Palaemon carinicauda TaxID=392227 RepID=UPI0035B58671